MDYIDRYSLSPPADSPPLLLPVVTSVSEKKKTGSKAVKVAQLEIEVEEDKDEPVVEEEQREVEMCTGMFFTALEMAEEQE